MSVYIGINVGYVFSPVYPKDFAVWSRTPEGIDELEIMENHYASFGDPEVKLASIDDKIYFMAPLRQSSFPACSGEVVPVAALLGASEREAPEDASIIERLKLRDAMPTSRDGEHLNSGTRGQTKALVQAGFEEMLLSEATPHLLRNRFDWIGPIEFFKVTS